MTDKMIIPDLTEEETEVAILQYELIRRDGACNMLDHPCVMKQAERFSFWILSSLPREDYLFILRNYSNLCDEYEIDMDIPDGDLDDRLESSAYR